MTRRRRGGGGGEGGGKALGGSCLSLAVDSVTDCLSGRLSLLFCSGLECRLVHLQFVRRRFLRRASTWQLFLENQSVLLSFRATCKNSLATR